MPDLLAMNLLIEPFGIEMMDAHYAESLHVELLIEPFGLEIFHDGQSDFEH